MDVVETLKKVGVVPVVVIEDAAKAAPMASALVEGGLNVVEVTFRTAAAADAIAAIRRDVPGAVVGAGTLLTPQMVRDAKEAGAAFGVAPGFDPAVVAAAKEAGLPFVPGVATASELSQALTAGAPMVKFFPAEAAGGVKMIRNLLGAFRFTGVKFMPTGGVNVGNLSEYLSVPEIVACGGTWLVPKDALAAGDWTRIRRLAAEAAEIARSRIA